MSFQPKKKKPKKLKKSIPAVLSKMLKGVWSQAEIDNIYERMKQTNLYCQEVLRKCKDIAYGYLRKRKNDPLNKKLPSEKRK